MEPDEKTKRLMEEHDVDEDIAEQAPRAGRICEGGAPISGRCRTAFGATTDANAYDSVLYHHVRGAWQVIRDCW